MRSSPSNLAASLAANPDAGTTAPAPDAAVCDVLLSGLAQSGEIVALYDANDWLRYANDAFRRTFLPGHDGRPIHFADVLRYGFARDVGVRIDCGDIERFLADILPRRGRQSRSIEVDTLDGRWLWMTETLLANGWMLCHAADITRLKHDEKTLRQSQAELAAKAEALARSNEALEQFAYVASHDLQEPLRTIGGFTQLLARHQARTGDSTAAEYVDYILGGVRRMQALIGGLLLYSRATSQALDAQPVALDAVLQTSLADLRAAIEAREARVTHDPLPTVRGDARQLAQLFQNLIGNALKFCGAAPRIHVGAERAGEDWAIAVRDNGIGIEPRYCEKIFAIFQRLHPSEAYEGTGLGLAICRKIVERHGGRIWAESAGAGSGTTVRFSLPARPPT